MHELSGVLVAAQRLVLRQMAAGSDFRETLSLIVRSAEQVRSDIRASILYFDAESGKLRVGGSGKLPCEFTAAVDGLVPGPAAGSCGTAAYRRRRVISTSVATDPIWATYREFAETHGIRSAWSTPLLSRKNGALLGVIGMYYGTEGSPSPGDLQIADHFAELATLALERVLHEQELLRLAREDALTGVLNRRATLDALSRQLASGAKNGISVAMLDIDYFQYFNHILGHSAGDGILSALAGRLKGLLPVGCQLGRLSADRFLFFSTAPLETLQHLANAILDTCRNPLPVGDHGIAVSVTIAVDNSGISADATLETILDHLSCALRHRSTLGRNLVVPVTADDRAKVRELRQLRTTLNEAVVNRRYEPFFQPIFDLATEECVGFEAMIRFPDAIDTPIHRTLDLAAASPVLEQIGLGIFERVCDLVQLWRHQIGNRFVAVNISAAQLIQGDIAFRLRQIVAGAGLSPRQFCLEIDENRLDPTAEPLYSNLRELREEGFRLALDGLENGTASLRSLFCGHFEMVKLRRIESADTLPADIEAVRRVVFSMASAVAAAANVSVCAKNIENAADRERARAAGFRYGQGFYWAKALPIDEALAAVRPDEAVPADASEQASDNRRQEPRNLCASLAGVSWTDAAGNPCYSDANVLDVSTRGVGLQIDEPIAAGTPVRIQWKGHTLTGRIRHVHESAIGPVVGVEFDEDSRWSEFLLSPEYILNA